MPLKHPLLASSTRLDRATTNSPVLRAGERGDAVIRLQLALVFGLYAAEQIACQVESGVPSVVSTVNVAVPHVSHPLNELSLALPRWEVRGAGVTTSC